MVLRAKYISVALALQEAAGDMTATEIRNKLSSAVSAAHKGTGKYGSYIDHVGDEDSGDCIYDCSGPSYDSPSQSMKAPYSKGTDSSDDDYTVDTSKAKPVAMRTSWEEQGDDADGYASMAEAKLYTPGGVPLCERFVSKKERSAASSGDFAGKGKSFPILKKEDVAAAAASIGRAGSDNYSTDVIKKKIIAKAKEKGWTSELPKAWQDGDDANPKEAALPAVGALKLVESCPFSVDIQLREAFTPGRMIKLIAPGKGSSAFYTEAVLRKAATDKIFHAGTPMRIDHPTKAEEAARPEGSVKDWGAVLESDAVYRDDLPTGPGLYAPIKKFSDHAQTIEEKGPYAGVSIRANGNAVTEAGRPVLKDGVPLLKEFTSAEGADMVTRAGAGGMFLTEAARVANLNIGGGELTTEEATKLIEAAVKPFQTRFLREEARTEAGALLKAVSLPDAAKARITERAVASVPQTADGGLDLTKFRESVVAEAKSEGEYLSSVTGGGRVFGMGLPGVAPVALKPEEIAAREAQAKKTMDESVAVFESLGMSKRAAEAAAKGRPA